MGIIFTCVIISWNEITPGTEIISISLVRSVPTENHVVVPRFASQRACSCQNGFRITLLSGECLNIKCRTDIRPNILYPTCHKVPNSVRNSESVWLYQGYMVNFWEMKSWTIIYLMCTAVI